MILASDKFKVAVLLNYYPIKNRKCSEEKLCLVCGDHSFIEYWLLLTNAISELSISIA